MRIGVKVILHSFRRSDRIAAGHRRRLQLLPQIGISGPVSLRRKTPRKRLHWFSAVMVFLSSWISGFFIIVTDAWVQHAVVYAHEQLRGSWLSLPFHILTNDISAFLQKLAVFWLEGIQDVTIHVDFSHNLPSYADGRDDFGFRIQRT